MKWIFENLIPIVLSLASTIKCPPRWASSLRICCPNGFGLISPGIAFYLLGLRMGSLIYFTDPKDQQQEFSLFLRRLGLIQFSAISFYFSFFLSNIFFYSSTSLNWIQIWKEGLVWMSPFLQTKSIWSSDPHAQIYNM